jgi:prepilin-type processing-associated H-X9-DG protein
MNDAPGMFSRVPQNNPANIKKWRPVHFADVLDGLANTIIVGETLPSHSIHNQAWGNNYPLLATNIPINTMRGSNWNGFNLRPENHPAGYHDNLDDRAQGIKSLHPGMANVAMCDGSARFLNQSMSFVVFNALGTRKWGEAVTVP